VQKHQPAIEPDELPALLRALDQYAAQGGEAQTLTLPAKNVSLAE
jgi:hypothetical protein